MKSESLNEIKNKILKEISDVISLKETSLKEISDEISLTATTSEEISRRAELYSLYSTTNIPNEGYIENASSTGGKLYIDDRYMTCTDNRVSYNREVCGVTFGVYGMHLNLNDVDFIVCCIHTAMREGLWENPKGIDNIDEYAKTLLKKLGAEDVDVNKFIDYPN